LLGAGCGTTKTVVAVPQNSYISSHVEKREDQLHGLEKINKLVEKHVKERNVVRAKIKELE